MVNGLLCRNIAKTPVPGGALLFSLLSTFSEIQNGTGEGLLGFVTIFLLSVEPRINSAASHHFTP